MSVVRLRPLSTLAARTAGRCAACEKPVTERQVSVRVYGELFHRDCAFYRSRGRLKSSA